MIIMENGVKASNNRTVLNISQGIHPHDIHTYGMFLFQKCLDLGIRLLILFEIGFLKVKHDNPFVTEFVEMVQIEPVQSG